jgi:catechol 2,3-dioxygenase-like lactoylglutathione lyase family enzyme
MPTNGLNHVNIESNSQELTRAFYEALGMSPGYRGPATTKGDWFYDESTKPVVHVTYVNYFSTAIGPVHHVAFTGVDLSEMWAKLMVCEAAQLPRLRRLRGDGILQIFVAGPSNERIEIAFSKDERLPPDVEVEEV